MLFEKEDRHRRGSIDSSIMGGLLPQESQFIPMNSIVHLPQPDINPIHLPREYARVNSDEKPSSHSKVEGFKINWNSLENYKVVQKIGRGKYSEVFNGIHTGSYQRVCVKLLKPVRKFKILREIKILQILYGGPNIIGLHDVARDETT